MDDVLAVKMFERHEDLGGEELGDPLRQAALLTIQDHRQHVTYKILNYFFRLKNESNVRRKLSSSSKIDYSYSLNSFYLSASP